MPGSPGSKSAPTSASRPARHRPNAPRDRARASAGPQPTRGELRRLERYHPLIVDEVGYLPLERQAANLLFALVSRRYERGSIIITSNRGFEQWGEILGDAVVAAALSVSIAGSRCSPTRGAPASEGQICSEAV
jgi:hypothetical protein